MRFYYHLLHITKRLYVSHNGGCEAQVRHKKAPHLSAGGHSGRVVPPLRVQPLYHKKILVMKSVS